MFCTGEQMRVCHLSSTLRDVVQTLHMYHICLYFEKKQSSVCRIQLGNICGVIDVAHVMILKDLITCSCSCALCLIRSPPWLSIRLTPLLVFIRTFMCQCTCLQGLSLLQVVELLHNVVDLFLQRLDGSIFCRF